MEQMNGSPSSWLPVGVVVVVASVVLSFVSPWGGVVGVDADVVVGLALVVTSFVSLWVGEVVVVESIVYRSIAMACVTHRLCRVGRFLEIGDWDHLNNMITMLQQEARRIVLVFRNQTQRKYTGTHVLPGTQVLYTHA